MSCHKIKPTPLEYNTSAFSISIRDKLQRFFENLTPCFRNYSIIKYSFVILSRIFFIHIRRTSLAWNSLISIVQNYTLNNTKFETNICNPHIWYQKLFHILQIHLLSAVGISYFEIKQTLLEWNSSVSTG